MDGARDPDQISQMSIPSASNGIDIYTATLHGGLVHVHARQVNAHPHVAYEDMTAEEKMAWRIRVMDMDESDGCIDWLHLAPIDHEQPLCALESSSSINVSATTPAVTSNKEKEREMVIETDDCSIDCLNPVPVESVPSCGNLNIPYASFILCLQYSYSAFAYLLALLNQEALSCSIYRGASKAIYHCSLLLFPRKRCSWN